MNREIKFRAWDKAYKAMCQTDGGTENLSGWLQNPEIFVVMQYTGLKDKNGKEIYEGDIVQLPYITPLGDIGGDGGIDERGKVVFTQGAFMLHMNFEPEPRPMLGMIERSMGDYVPNYGNTTVYGDKTLFEVIGNIYENPELLKEQ